MTNLFNSKHFKLIFMAFLPWFYLTWTNSFDHDKLKRLVDFITVMPPEDATH